MIEMAEARLRALTPPFATASRCLSNDRNGGSPFKGIDTLCRPNFFIFFHHRNGVSPFKGIDTSKGEIPSLHMVYRNGVSPFKGIDTL